MSVQRSNSTGKLAFSKQRHWPVRIKRAQPAAQSRYTPAELLLYTRALGGTHPVSPPFEFFKAEIIQPHKGADMLCLLPKKRKPTNQKMNS